MSGNSVTASTIYSTNTVQGGPNDVVVNNETVQGDLTVDGTVDIGLATIDGLNVDGNAQVKGDLTVGYGGAASNIACSGNISGNTLSITGVAQCNSTLNTNSLIVPEDAQIGGLLTTPFLQVNGSSTSKNTILNGDVEITGITDATDLIVDNNISSLFTSVGTITVTNTPVSEIYNATGYAIATFTTPAITTATYKVQLDNINVTFGYNTYASLAGLQGIAQREVLLGIVQSPWNGVVDARFSYFKYFRKQWNFNHTGGNWYQTVPNETFTSSFSKVMTLSGSTTYNLIIYAPTIPNIDGIYTVDANNSTPLNYEYFFNSSTNTIQLRIAQPYIGVKFAINSAPFGIAPATPSSLPFVESSISTSFADADYRYYNLVAPYSPQYTVKDSWTSIKIYSRNPGRLSSSSTITCSINNINSVAANNVVSVGKYAVTDGLNVNTGVTSTSTTTGSIVTNGGVGVGGTIYAGGSVVCTTVQAGVTPPAYSASMRIMSSANTDTAVNGTLLGSSNGVLAYIQNGNTKIMNMSTDAGNTTYLGSYGGSGAEPDYHTFFKDDGKWCLQGNGVTGNAADVTDLLTVRGTARIDQAFKLYAPIQVNYTTSALTLTNQIGYNTLVSSTTAPGTAYTDVLTGVLPDLGVYMVEASQEYTNSTNSVRELCVNWDSVTWNYRISTMGHNVNGYYAMTASNIMHNVFTTNKTIYMIARCSAGTPTAVGNTLKITRIA